MNIFLELVGNTNFNLVYSSEPFLKQTFLDRILNVDYKILYLDFDLLYSGYVKMGFSLQPPNSILYQIYDNNIEEKLIYTLQTISKQRSFVILDTLNGFYGLYKEIGMKRRLNSYLMLLSTVAHYSNSIILCTCIARKGDDLVLTPSGQHPLQSKHMNIIHLKKNGSKITLDLLDADLQIQRSVSF